MATDNIIEIKNIRKKFGDFNAVDDISLSIKRGEIFSILGPNGAGKTTTINLILGLIKITGGKILVDGEEIQGHAEEIKNKIGFLTQETIVEGELTARQNLDIAASLYHVEKGLKEKRIQQALEESELIDFADKKAGTFSGGMQRRLALVKSMVHEPKILILDEPTTGLDVHNRVQMWEKIKKLNRSGITIILTTQYLEEADELSNRIAIIDHGKVMALGTVSELKKLVSTGSILEIVAEKDDVGEIVKLLKSKFDLAATAKEDRIVAPVGGDASKMLLKVGDALEKKKIKITSISMHLPTLDDVFIKLTGSGLRDTASGSASSAWTKAATQSRRG